MSEVTDSTLAAEAEDVDLLGPVDWIVVEFPGSRFDGTIFPILLDLEAQGTIRVLDLVVLKKDAEGTLEAFELSDLEDSEIGGLRDAERQLATLLSEEDVLNVANAIEPGSAAALLVWENTWAAPFASAVRKAGGQLVASGRIPVQALLAAIEADTADADEEGAAADAVPRRPIRRRRRRLDSLLLHLVRPAPTVRRQPATRAQFWRSPTESSSRLRSTAGAWWFARTTVLSRF